MISARRIAFRTLQTELQEIVSCVTRSVMVAQGEVPGKPDRMVLTPLAQVRGYAPVTVSIGHFVDVIQPQGSSGWQLRTAKYIYSVRDQHGPILAYHFHPSDTPDIPFPHLHVYRAGDIAGNLIGDMHLPTRLIALADFVRMLHRELGVPYLRGDAEDVLGRVLDSDAGDR